MRCAAVSTAVSLIADTVGTLPVKLYASDEAGGKSPKAEHPAYAVVHDEASPWVSASQLRTQLTTDALLHGNGFAFANRVGGRVVEFNRLDPRSVTVLVDDLTGEPAYRVSNGATHDIFRREDILHIPAFSLDGVKGVSPVQLCREAIALALVLEQHAGQLFANGARPSGVLKFPGKLTPESASRMKASWQAATAGTNAGGTAVMEEGGDFNPLAFTSVDAQFAEMRTFQIVEIARAFRVPPSMLFELGRATWGNAEQMGSVFYRLTLLPWLRTWTDALSRLLLTSEERKTHSIEFVVDDLMRADTATRFAAYAQARAAGVLTSNEIRELENRPARPDGDTLANPNITTTPAAPALEAEAA
ncbi:phage portal protein [Chelatococcus sambhunathii]|uniref:Phage portal protein n=2 Tax=Chelatococcus sambhunathii TaxID=363953 RepID=A0ABU1DET7_9HYPH|nr:phage portal protein [Chelatococcus sambhunathii]